MDPSPGTQTQRPLERLAIGLLVLFGWVAISGATCMPRRAPEAPLGPAAFLAPPTLEELTHVLNSNASRVWQLATNSASISSGYLPGIRADIRLERPVRFRLQGKLVGPEIDFGSNDEVIWFWAKSNPNNAVYFARHDQQSSARGLPLPVEPEWLIDAFGLIELRDSDFHEGPYTHSNGLTEVRSRLRRANGDLIRSIMVDSRYGWVLEQQISDPAGRVLAAVHAAQHRYNEEAGVWLPHMIQVELPTVQVNFQIDVSSYAVNQLLDDPVELWTMPVFEGQPAVRLDEMPGASGLSGQPRNALYQAHNAQQFRPPVRGYPVR